MLILGASLAASHLYPPGQICAKAPGHRGRQSSGTALIDIRTAGEHIAEVASGLRAYPGEEVLNAHGGTIVPGIHDHHVHLRAWAASYSSIMVGPPKVKDAMALATALRDADSNPWSSSSSSGEARGWIRAVGYHESVAGNLDRWSLDSMLPHRPLQLQHRSGSLWILNTRALAALGLEAPDRSSPDLNDFGPQSSRFSPAQRMLSPNSLPPGIELDDYGRPTGRIWRQDRWLNNRLRAIKGDIPLDLAQISRQAAAWGVTGFTDATADMDDSSLEQLAKAKSSGLIAQRLHLMVAPGSKIDPHGVLAPGVSTGAVKIVLDDDKLPTFRALCDLILQAHRRQRPIAVHCVTRVQACLLVAALEEVKSLPGDRIEHGAVLSADIIRSIKDLGVTVVTQPSFVSTRGDQYLADLDREDLRDLWRLGTLMDTGVRVALSTDAPFGHCNPWLSVLAASTRQAPSGRTLGPQERISRGSALSLFFGRANHPTTLRTVSPGQPADLIILDEWYKNLGAPAVLATIIGGKVIHERLG